MDLNNAAIWAGIISDITSSIAFIIGGIWVYGNYIYNRTGVWNLKMVIMPEVMPYNEYNKLLNINIALSNEGNIKITPGSHGCQVTVKKIGKEAAQNQIIDLDAGEIMAETDILRPYYHQDVGYQRYEIEPKAEYHELACVVVSPGDILSIRAEFFWQDDKDSITEYSVFYVK